MIYKIDWEGRIVGLCLINLYFKGVLGDFLK